MIFQPNTTWSDGNTMQSNATKNFAANYQTRFNQPRISQFQKNDVKSARRYSSGTPTNLQSGFRMPSNQSTINGSRKVANKGAYRSATFHQPNNGSFNDYRQSQNTTQGGQLRTSSSFHGCIQPHQVTYAGRNSYTAPGQQKQSTQKSSIYTSAGRYYPGMKDVPMWLKSLRLHKYTCMFQEMSYDEMMALDDQKLEQRQVTKGARKKIMQSLNKLRDRSQLIRQLEKCIDEHGDVRCLIVELRAMMHTPIAAYKPSADSESKSSNYAIDAIGIPASEVSDDNLPGHIARLCIRLHEFFFRNGLPKIQELGIEDEYLLKLLQVYDKILSNEAFTYRQRYCIYECKRVISRYMFEQNIVSRAISNSQSSMSQQPTLVSSPSSGCHTMSPPASLTRRNSDTKESVEDLTATTTATNSDDDLRISSSAPSSPLAHLFVPAQQRRSPEQWSQQQQKQCPPGLEWHQTTNQQHQVSQKPLSTASGPAVFSHFQPYVNDQFVNIGLSTAQNQQRQSGWYNQQQQQQSESNQFGFAASNQTSGAATHFQRQSQWEPRKGETIDKSELLSLFDLTSTLPNCLTQQRQESAYVKPPKAPSPIGTRPANYLLQQQKSSQHAEVLLPLTIIEKIRYIACDSEGPEILDLAMQLKRLKAQHRETQTPTQQQSILWQNLNEQPKQQPAQTPVQTSLWSNVTAKPALKSTLYNNSERLPTNSHSPFNNDFKSRTDFFDPWSTDHGQQLDLSLSDQLTTSTASIGRSDGFFDKKAAHASSNLIDANMLNRMLSDTQMYGQNQQRNQIMRQYTLSDGSTPPESRLFSGIVRTENLRSMLDDHSKEPLFAALQPLPCTASGAVH